MTDSFSLNPNSRAGLDIVHDSCYSLVRKCHTGLMWKMLLAIQLPLQKWWEILTGMLRTVTRINSDRPVAWKRFSSGMALTKAPSARCDFCWPTWPKSLSDDVRECCGLFEDSLRTVEHSPTLYRRPGLTHVIHFLLPDWTASSNTLKIFLRKSCMLKHRTTFYNIDQQCWAPVHTLRLL